MSDELPEGWAQTSLSELLSEPLRNGHSARASADGSGVRTLTLSAVTYGDFSIKNTKVTIADPAKVADLWLEPGDLLIERANTPELVGTTRLYKGPPNFAIFPDLVIRARLLPEVLPEFVELMLQSQNVRRYFIDIAQGSAGTMPKIDQGAVLGVSILLPPIAEQRRIIPIVEALMAEHSATRARLAKVSLILKRFRQSVLAAACSGKLSEDWRQASSAEGRPKSVTEKICDDRAQRKVPGARGPASIMQSDIPSSLPEDWLQCETAALCRPERALTYGVVKLGLPVPDGTPTLRSSDVRALFIDEDGVKRISSAIAAEYSRTTLAGGEVLITVRGTLGGVAVVPDHMAGYNVSREVAVLPVEPAMNAKFIAFAIAALPSQNWLSERAKGVAYTGINIEDLRLLPLPVPSRAEQDEIVRRVEALFALADDIEHRLAVAIARTDKVPQGILAKAFRGELVPTEAELARAEGRDFEPARVLLERLRKERGAAEPTAGRGRKKAALAKGPARDKRASARQGAGR